MLQRLLRALRDSLFPAHCVVCDSEGSYWCDSCRSLVKNSVLRCPICGVVARRGETCEKCKKTSNLDGLVAFFIYDESSAGGKLVRMWKYHFVRSIREVWQKLVAEHKLVIPEVDSVVSVPLHSRRERERGFNQAHDLAEIFSATYRMSLAPTGTLRRVRATKQQATLGGAERQENVANAFVWAGERVAPKRVLLIDDVYTTGSTMQECARVLKENGAELVWGAVLARGQGVLVDED